MKISTFFLILFIAPAYLFGQDRIPNQNQVSNDSDLFEYPKKDKEKQESKKIESVKYECENNLLEVMFAPNSKVRLRNGNLVDSKTNATDGASAILEGLQWHEWKRFCDVPEDFLDELSENGTRNSGQPVYNLNNIYRLQTPEQENIWELAQALENLDGIIYARPVPLPMELPIPTNYEDDQGYLDPSDEVPSGIDAEYAWTQSGGTGAGITICDLEYSWNYNHADVTKAWASQINSNVADPFNDNNHGTAVIGQLVSNNNGWGTTGASYGSSLKTCGTFYGSPSPSWNVAGAMAVAIADLSAGDIILLEQQWDYTGSNGFVPIEWWGNTSPNAQTNNPVYAAVVNAVANGIHVVQAGGNGNVNTGNLTWVGNSGSVIVGAGQATTWNDLRKINFSSYGPRFDAQGWGHNVTTTGYGSLYNAEGANYFYTSGFNGTSSASPIVTSAIANFSSYWKQNWSATPPTPANMRHILKRHGRLQVDPEDGNIGRRPDLKAMIDGFRYCVGYGGCSEHISRVQIGDIDNSSDCDEYVDYTSTESTSIPSNLSETLTVTMGNPYSSSNQCGVWVDWNRDYDFDDPGETITVSGTPGLGPYTATISPPAGTTPGDVRMRVRIMYSGVVSPCGSTSFGEVEDYTITVADPMPNQWVGLMSDSWHNALNWSLGHIPTDDEKAVIVNMGHHPPRTGTSNVEIKSLEIQSGASLKVQEGELDVLEDMNIYGELWVTHNGVNITCFGDVFWHAGSTAEFDEFHPFWVYGNMNFLEGSNVQMLDGTVAFTGNGTSWIRNYSQSTVFNNLGSYKTDIGNCWISDLTTQDLTINGNLYIHPNAHFGISSDHVVELKGPLYNNGEFDFTGASNDGVFIFSGDNQSIIMNSPNGIFNNVIFNSTTTTNSDGDFEVVGDLTIESGNFDPQGNTISVAGNWINNVGPDGFVETDSRIIFNGSGHQYVYGDEHFNILEVNNGAALRLNSASYDVSCNTYDWTAGGIDVIAGNFTAYDLAEDGLYGTWWCNPNGTITVTQDESNWVDLNGEVHIFGGTMTVNGGSGTSWWPFTADAVIHMTGGTLDFTDVSIRLSTSFDLTENITGGKIRCQQGFLDYRGDFTPEGGTLELYGPDDVNILLTEGSYLNELAINKQADKQNTSGKRDFIVFRDGTKAPVTRGSTVIATSNILVNNDLKIHTGILDVANYNIEVADSVHIHGTLKMNDIASDLTANMIEWFAGSEDDVTAGTFHADAWRFNEGTNAMIGVDNTAYLQGLYYSLDDNAEFGNLVAQPLSKLRTIPEKRAYYPTRVSGNFTIQSGADWYFNQPDAGMVVNGDVIIEDGASLYFYNNEFLVDGNINLSGSLYIYDEAFASVHGEITWPETGAMYINNGEVIFDAPQHSKGWEYINGHLELTEGLFEVSNNSPRFGSTASSNVSGGIIRSGIGFYAADPNVFEPTGGTVEFVSDVDMGNIWCINGNFFYNLKVNKAPDADCRFLDGPVTIKNDLTIESGILNSLTNTIFVGGDWTNNVGPDGFMENENEVWFYGEAYSHIITNETFYDLIIFDYLTDLPPKNDGEIVDETYIDDGIHVNVTNNCRFLGGSLNMGNNAVLNVDNNFIFNGGQCIVPDGTTAEISVGGHYTNFNPGQAFFPGSSTFTFDGTADQEITTDFLTVYFNNLVIDNPGNFVEFFLSTHVYGDVHAINGTYVNSGLFSHINTFEGDITVEPNGGFLPKGVINFEGNENTVFDDKSTITSYLWGDVYVDKSADDLKLILNDGMQILNFYSIDVLNGIVDLNGNTLRCTENVTIHDGAKIIVDAGGELEVGEASMLKVMNGGTLEVSGQEGNPATVTAWNSSLGHRYECVIEPGGTISASHGNFSYLEAGYGVYVMEGALVDTENSFDYCEFKFGETNGFSTFLTINNDQVLTITGASFPDASCDFNVGKDFNQGHLTFEDFSGDFAGEDFDYDPYNLIDWYEPTLEATPLIVEVGSDAGTTDFDVISNLDWTATESSGWFSISPTFGNGNTLVNINYDENESINERSGEITLSAPGVSDVVVTVNQAGADPVLVVSPPEHNVSPDAGMVIFNVTSNTSWTATEAETWFDISPGAGSGNGTIQVDYDENPSTSGRSGEINISVPGLPTVEVYVNQAGTSAYLTVSPTSQSVGPDAGYFTFNILSNIDWLATSATEWLTVFPASGSGDGMFDVDFELNATGAPRTAEIEIWEDGGGISQTVTLTQSSHPSHSILLPAGWSGLSSYLQPANNNLDVIFNPILPNLVIAQTLSGIYYPDGPVNTIGAWWSQSAFAVKMDASATLTLVGPEESNKTFFLPVGWSMLPVIANEPVATSALLAGLDFAIVKSLAGTGVYWPAMNINTLEMLQPGLAYYILVNSFGSVTFPPNTDGAMPIEILTEKTPINPWNEIHSAASSHIIAIDMNGLQGISMGDVVGVFAANGNCYGIGEISSLEQNGVVTVFADDPYTEAVDGFEDGEAMTFKIYRPATHEEFEVDATFDLEQPNTGLFSEHGISVISGMKLSSTGIGTLLSDAISLYPNPTDGQVKVSGIGDFNQVEIYNTAGKLEQQIGLNFDNEITIDLSDLPAGVYQLRFTGNKATVIKKLIRK